MTEKTKNTYPVQRRQIVHHHHSFYKPKQILRWTWEPEQPYRQWDGVRTRFQASQSLVGIVLYKTRYSMLKIQNRVILVSNLKVMHLINHVKLELLLNVIYNPNNVLDSLKTCCGFSKSRVVVHAGHEVNLVKTTAVEG